jgi:Mce-associated membrane protein
MGVAASHVDADAEVDWDDTEIGVQSQVESDTEASQDAVDSPGAQSGAQEDAEGVAPKKRRLGVDWRRVVALGVLPALAVMIAAMVGYLKWENLSFRASEVSSIESIAAAKDSTIALLSYHADSVEKDLGAARDRLTGTFKDSYTQLTHEVVIPGAKQKHISAVATVPAASSVSASWDHAVALLYVDQTVTVGNDPPTDTISTVRVTLDKVAGRWLISAFDPL